MKKTIVISTLIIIILLSGCTKNDINSTIEAYSYLTENVDKNSSLNIDLLKNQFKSLQYKDVTSSKIQQLSDENIKNYSAYSFSDEEDEITIFYENEDIIAIENNSKIDDSDTYIRYITNKNIEEVVSTYKESTSLRVRESSNYFEQQEELINLTTNEINSNSLSEYKKLVKLIADNTNLSLSDIENTLKKESVYSENREVNNVDTMLYTFDYSDSTISVFIDSTNIVQCIIADNLTTQQDTTTTSYVFEFNPYMTETTFRTSVYHVNTPNEVQSFNNHILNILK